MPIFAVTTERGPRWDADRDIRAQDGWDAHAARMDRLADEGRVLLGGPVDDGQAGDLALLVIRADSPGQVRAMFDEDPWVTAGLIRVATVRPWEIWLGSLADAVKT